MTTITRMIRYTTGDIFDAQTDAIINTVNTVGVMGKGIALQFKQRFPANFAVYKQACEEGSFQIGDLLITEGDSLFFKYIVNFPTKKHWRQPSQYEYIERGLKSLVKQIPELDIRSIAIPALGAGNGKLDWVKVKAMIEHHLSALTEIDVVIYEPQGRFEARDISGKKPVSLTPVRAMLLKAFADYDQVDASLNLLVAQKLAYFLQRLGQPLRLTYQKGWYGPYAPVLNKVLQAINGTYLQYDAHKDQPDTRILLIAEKEPEINQHLNLLNQEQQLYAERLAHFVARFETPFSLELLATVDWILQEQPDLTPEQIHQEIGQWTRRKAELIQVRHVQVAHAHLKGYAEILYPAPSFQ